MPKSFPVSPSARSSDMPSLVGATLAVPATALVDGARQLFVGSKVVLDVKVEGWDGLLGRQRHLHRLERAATDDAVDAVLLRLQAPPGGFATCHDLRVVIGRLRASGKAVYALLETPGNALVWIAAACERVFLVPTGELSLLGVGSELTFLGAALRRLGVEPDLEAAGEYKSAGETFTRSFASGPNREATAALVDDLQAQLARGIAEGRHLDEAVVAEAFARAPLSAADAVELGLVDQLAYADEVEHWLEEHHGKKVKRVNFDRWARFDGAREWVDGWADGGERIAIVHLEGAIVLDARTGTRVRARRVVPLLRSLREQKRVKAVVLHVNSPGGSAFASDLIWREVELLGHDKPVVACFESVAASGGYYLSAPAAEIIARPSTLTGSIGVFGGKLVLGDALRKLGVHVQTVDGAPNATYLSATRAFTPEQRVRFRATLERIYGEFVHRVASGRRRAEEVVEPVCRGRVWTGRAAREHGLVDRFGDLSVAVERARELSGLAPGGYRRVDMVAEPRRSLLHRLVQGSLGGTPLGARAALASAVVDLLGAPDSDAVDVMLTHVGEPLTMLPFDLRVR